MASWPLRVLSCASLLVGAPAAAAQGLPPQPPTVPSPTDEDLSAIVDGVDDAVERIAKRSRAQASVHLSNRNYPAALRELTTLNTFQPGEPQVTEELGDLHVLVGNRAEAEEFYRETIDLLPEEGEVYLKLVELLTNTQGEERHARMSEAVELLNRAQTLLGNTPQVSLQAARLYAGLGRFDPARAAYARVLAARDEPAMLLEVGDFLRDFGRHELALEHYRRVQRPPALVRDAAQRIFELEVLGEARRLGLDARKERVPEAVRSLVSRARQMAAGGSPKRALPLIDEALSQAPVFADAHALRARVMARIGDRPAAEVSYLRALSLEGGRAEWLAALSELYEEETPARRAEAALLLGRALRLRPDWAELHLRLARVERLRGDLPRALAHVKRYLSQRGEGPEHQEAVRLRDELTRTLGPAHAAPAAPAPDPLTADPAQHALQRARAHLGRGETDAALTVLRGLTGPARSPEVRLLEARVLNASGRHGEAAAVLTRLVRIHDKPALIRELASTLERAGHPVRARRRWLQAESRGDAEASYELARMDARPSATRFAPLGDIIRFIPLLQAYQRLSAVPLVEATSELAARAASLRLHVRDRLIAATVVVALGILLVTLGPLMWLRRRNGGSDLYELVTRHPESGPDVQRIMAAVRHEVLKHNTMMLAGLSQALASGKPAGDHGRHLRHALFGDSHGHGAAHRLELYIGQLRRLGRTHGMRLNLERRDPVTRVLLAGMGVLQRLGTRLDRLDRLRPGARRRVREQLQRADELLNERGYSEVRALLDHIRVFTVDEQALSAVFERVRREPAIATLPVAPLAIEANESLPCTVDVPQAAFEDIMANLMRNAIQSESRQQSAGSREAGAIAVGVQVVLERDPVTALSSVTFAVRDRAQQTLTQAELHGQYIEQGLGLTADLVARYHGSLDVRPEAPGTSWVKAVVLTVPHVEYAAG